MKKLFSVALGLTLIGLLLSVVRPAFFETLEGKLYDLHFALRNPVPRSDRIVVVAIDEKSLQSLGRWPWPRGVIARIFETIISKGARVVVPDIFFAEPSGGPLGQKNDEAMAQTLRNHPNIFMGYFFLMSPEELKESSISDKKLEENFRFLQDSALSFEPDSPAIQRLKKIRKPLGIQGTLPIFSDLPGGRRHGFFNILSDPDGTVRATSLLMAYRGNIFPSLALQVVMALVDHPGPAFIDRLRLDPAGDFLINFRGSGTAFPRMSVDDLLKDQESVSLKDKVVFVGATAAGLVDNRPTPVGPAVSSDVLAANVIDNILEGDFLRRDSLTDLFSRLLILAVGFLLAVCLPQMKPAPSFFLFLGVMVAQALILHLFFARVGWVLQSFYPLFSGFLVYGGTSLYGYLVQEKEKRFISETFGHYLSHDVIQELTAHPEKVRLGGEKKELTVFFSDIRDFATIVEATPAETLVDFLNKFLTPVTDVIFQHKGLLDKYIGDAVMAVFGAPLYEPDHPRLACQSAVDIIRMVNASRGKWEKEFNISGLRLGIGLNTGLMTVGNMGSERRFDYTVLGDAVNLASRLEGLNKFYGTSLLVSHSTYEKVKELFLFRELDQVQVKGKKETIRIYELLVDPPFHSEKMLPLFSEALQVYRQGSFAKAKSLFETCLTLAPDDGPSRLLIERCGQMEANPPKDWLGVTTFLRK